MEGALANWLVVEACLLFSSGYAANVGALSALVGPGETVISDALNHASIIDGCRLSRARTVIIPHGDVGALERALADTSGVRWVVYESYYGMDGDSPDLCRIRDICDRTGAAMIVDEAHAIGVFGPEGRGLCAERGVVPDILVGGLGKAFGAQGGFVATTALFRDWLWNRARSFVFSTGSSPALSALILERLAVVRGAERERAHLRALGRRLEQRLLDIGVALPSGRHGPIFPVVFGGEAEVLAAARSTAAAGVICQPIRPPTVPLGGSRLRIILNAAMNDVDVDAIAAAVEAAWRNRSAGARQERASGAEAGDAPQGARASLAAVAEPWGQRGHEARVEAPKAAGARSASAAGAGGAEWTSREREAGRLVAPAETGVARPFNEVAVGLMAPAAEAGPTPRTSVHAAGGRSAWRGGGARAGSRRWIVLGVGTGIGKTYVARALLEQLASRAVATIGLKPIETGVAGPSDASTDAAALERASLHVKHPQPHPLYAFSDPVTPALAARREHSTIDLQRVRCWVDSATAELPDAPMHTIIETAGGVFSPLADGITNLDLASTLGDATWLLVAADRLGVLHDVSSTLTAMRVYGAAPDYLILSAPAHPDASTGTNAAELRRLPAMPPIIELPRGATDPLAALLAST